MDIHHDAIAKCNGCGKPLIAQVLRNVYEGLKPNIELVCDCGMGHTLFSLDTHDFERLEPFTKQQKDNLVSIEKSCRGPKLIKKWGGSLIIKFSPDEVKILDLKKNDIVNVHVVKIENDESFIEPPPEPFTGDEDIQQINTEDLNDTDL